ncbi:uncharacterized protein LOC128219818 isoform X2 [Mya arenaria]|uniref:uncharacterized protein LOC128219818 isoform X2 n=1 Tax=Mya arenaria TaxID=6604 RepID=UPI0022E17247|nr:uncharacterized protein LOC128219818 isoform X2 [Mya arenaria]
MYSLKCVIVTILYFFGEICKGQRVFVSQDDTRWDESSCTLAVPKITCKDNSSCIVENYLEFTTNEEDQDNGFWIGYAQTWISYAYLGCGHLNAGAEYFVSTLGECRRTTGCKTFGIHKSIVGLRCKCASKIDSWIQTSGEKCREVDQYPCGNTAATIFSYYTVENVPPSEHSHNIHNNCLQFFYKNRPGNDYHWESCTSNTFPNLLCSNKYFSEYNPMAEQHYQSDGIWAQAVENCVFGGKFPASIQSIKNGNFTDQNSQNYWTGIIKTESIISLSDVLDNSTNPPLTYAYVKKINQTAYVKFAYKGESRKSLCEGGSTAGLAAGLSVSLVLLITVTVIVLVFLKRRGLLTKCYTRKGEKGNRNEDTRTEISFVSTPIFESTTNTTNDLTASNHSYFVLEKTFNRETKEETEHYAEPDTTDVVDHYELTEISQKDTTNDDYDTTDGKKGPAKSGLAKSNNNYNKVTLHQSNEYDHIHQNGRPPKSDRQSEYEYDVSNNVIDGKRNDNFGDDGDTYNHLNKHESESSGTDNVYGKSATDGDSGYDTSSALKPLRNKDANDQQADYAVIKKKW